MARQKRIGIRGLKNGASRIVNEVRERETEYVVTRRGEPAAVIRPWSEADSRDETAARVRSIVARIERTASQVGEAAGRRQAAAAVSRQRR